VTVTKYTCDACGYTYDPKIGDPEDNVLPVTAFEDLPDGWTCPECGAVKRLFYPDQEA